jgi:cysteinyl-tRNA synthetase
VLRHINTSLDAGGISEEVRGLLRQALDEADSVLGIFPASKTGAADDDDIQRLVDERTAARDARDFARADELRDQLTEMGIVIEDTPHGAVWHRKN